MLGTLCAVLLTLTSAPADAAAQPVGMNVWAVQALKTGSTEKQFDSGAQAVRKAVEDLPFDTFRGLFNGSTSAAPGAETRLRLNDTYTLLIQCRSRDGKNAAHIDITVELPPASPGDAPRKAVQSCMIICTGKMVRIGGLKMNEGEMVVVLEMTR
jgi:hypothetical protein